jgi:hypothetical protein
VLCELSTVVGKRSVAVAIEGTATIMIVLANVRCNRLPPQWMPRMAAHPRRSYPPRIAIAATNSHIPSVERNAAPKRHADHSESHSGSQSSVRVMFGNEHHTCVPLVRFPLRAAKPGCEASRHQAQTIVGNEARIEFVVNYYLIRSRSYLPFRDGSRNRRSFATKLCLTRRVTDTTSAP